MKTHRLPWLIVALFLVVLAARLHGAAVAETDPVDHAMAVADPDYLAITPVTTITVNSGRDIDTSNSTTCSTQPCTLRRAVNQARNLSAAQKPVLIRFDIPANAAEGYNSTLKIWKIEFIGISSVANAALRQLNGNIIIDGTTQPGGRTNGPKIILLGPGTGQWDGLKLGENATQSGNVIRGLGFQRFTTHIYATSHANTIENNWFGLNDAGNDIVLRGGGANDGTGNTGVAVMPNLNNNIVRNNVFTGLAGVAAAINGNDTTFANNYIGTIANGTVPGKTTNPAEICTRWDWLGGSGISLSGNRNVVENNVFAGLRINVQPPTIQADTIRMGGNDHVIRNNRIGLDVENNQVGVCGRGIYLQSSTKFNQITGNRIVEPGLSAISLNDSPTVSTSDANTLRGNTILRTAPWGQIDGNPEPENAIQLGPGIHAPFRNFMPARVTQISGLAVQGTAGTGSACPSCIVELFLDDGDSVTEALQSLAVVTANAQGNWTAMLAQPLPAGHGIRTTSTTAANGTIPNMSAGTTTGLSVLYRATPPPDSGHKLFLPVVTR
jgi:hypothetical protein